jgi:hypothetical protein
MERGSGNTHAIVSHVRASSRWLTPQISAKGRRGGQAGAAEHRTVPAAVARVPLGPLSCSLLFPATTMHFSATRVLPKVYNVEHCIILNTP